jgi:hypothetical protein
MNEVKEIFSTPNVFRMLAEACGWVVFAQTGPKAWFPFVTIQRIDGNGMANLRFEGSKIFWLNNRKGKTCQAITSWDLADPRSFEELKEWLNEKM